MKKMKIMMLAIMAIFIVAGNRTYASFPVK